MDEGKARMYLTLDRVSERIKQRWFEYIRRRRSEWWNRNIGKRESFSFELQRGLKILLYFDSILCQRMYCGEFERTERQFLIDFLRPGDVFVDIGANIGLYTLIAALCTRGSGQVYSFEPCMKTYQRLVKNVELNDMHHVRCHQMALSDHSGPIEMNVSLDGYDAWNSIMKPFEGSEFAIETVRAAKWDDLSREYKLMGKVKMMKIDVEGWEGHVLSGGCESFSRNDAPILQIELTDKACQSAGTSCHTLYRQLEEFGYKMFVYEEKTRRIVPDPLRDSYPCVNLLATKDQDEINSRLK